MLVRKLSTNLELTLQLSLHASPPYLRIKISSSRIITALQQTKVPPWSSLIRRVTNVLACLIPKFPLIQKSI